MSLGPSSAFSVRGTRMFDGLTSAWITPAACATERPSSRPRATRSTSWGKSARPSPSTESHTPSISSVTSHTPCVVLAELEHARDVARAQALQPLEDRRFAAEPLAELHGVEPGGHELDRDLGVVVAVARAKDRRETTRSKGRSELVAAPQKGAFSHVRERTRSWSRVATQSRGSCAAARPSTRATTEPLVQR